jgi:hypothetical protein
LKKKSYYYLQIRISGFIAPDYIAKWDVQHWGFGSLFGCFTRQCGLFKKATQTPNALLDIPFEMKCVFIVDTRLKKYFNVKVKKRQNSCIARNDNQARIPVL